MRVPTPGPSTPGGPAPARLDATCEQGSVASAGRPRCQPAAASIDAAYEQVPALRPRAVGAGLLMRGPTRPASSLRRFGRGTTGADQQRQASTPLRAGVRRFGRCTPDAGRRRRASIPPASGVPRIRPGAVRRLTSPATAQPGAQGAGAVSDRRRCRAREAPAAAPGKPNGMAQGRHRTVSGNENDPRTTYPREGRNLSGGQGRDRTGDLPLFRRTLVPTELPGRRHPF